MLLSLPLGAVPRVSSYPITIAMLSFAMFVTAGFPIAALAYATQHYSTMYSGLITGVGSGSWSAVVALVMPVVGRLFDLHRYNAAFTLATLLPIAGYVVWRTFRIGSSSRCSLILGRHHEIASRAFLPRELSLDAVQKLTVLQPAVAIAPDPLATGC
jgi:hypothetical protein